MDIVKLDSYEYEIFNLTPFDSCVPVTTILYITIDSAVDPSIFDIVRALSVSKKVHVDGRYFTCTGYEIEAHDPVRGGAVLKLYLEPNSSTKMSN